jgi:hypothetical protein
MSQDAVWSEKWVRALFQRFSTMYGSKFTTMWADVPMEAVIATWREDLAGVTPEQVRKALDHLKANNPFPPTLPEFLGLCRQHRMKAANVVYLPPPRGEIPEQFRAVIAKLTGRSVNGQA